MPKIIAISNQKGGVGKSVTAINLCSALNNFSKRVLLIDLDPQSDSSRGLKIDTSMLKRSIFDVLLNKCEINKAILKTPFDNFDIIPSKLPSYSVELLATKFDNPYSLLKDKISLIKNNYDYIVIDCPPSLGILTYNALNASDSVLIPVQCEYFALEAVSQMIATIAIVQQQFNPDLVIEGFLLTMFDSRNDHDQEIAKEIRSLFKENTFSSIIPRSISIPESNKQGIPVTHFKKTSSASLAYLSLAREIIDKE
ncbi:MAG: ParA family protein [Bacilli bacterium]|nr:ParA family protein [Bacilli bacterium]